jgi:hypothetical protein
MIDIQPALAFLIIHTDSMHVQGIPHYLPLLDRMQLSFRNCAAIFITANRDIHNPTWNELNDTAPAGRLRLFMVNDFNGAEAIMLDFFGALNQPEKLLAQRAYFEEEASARSSAARAKEIAVEALNRIGLSDDDASLIMQSQPTMKAIITCFVQNTPDIIAGQIPIDEAVVASVCSFFKDPLGR